MKPIAIVLFAVVARLLWAEPVWVAVVAGAGVVAWVGVDQWRHRVRMKAYTVQVDTNAEQWEQCGARRRIFDGFVVECVKRKGHDGDDADHLAGRDDIYWAGN